MFRKWLRTFAKSLTNTLDYGKLWVRIEEGDNGMRTAQQRVDAKVEAIKTILTHENMSPINKRTIWDALDSISNSTQTMSSMIQEVTDA